MSTIAVIGLGHMGGAVAARLAQHSPHLVRGYDLDPRARERAAADEVTPAPTLPEAVQDADVIITSLPTAMIVRQAWTAPEGILAAAGPGTILIELSTIDPATMRDLGAAARDRGLRVLDCPVSGGPADARTGTLTLLVGGDDATIAEASVLPVLGTVRRTGTIGSGKVVKIVNNMMSMGNVLVAAEAFSVGVTAGVEPDTLYDVLAHSGGTSHHFTKRFPKALAGDYEPGFSIELGEKDLALAIELARSVAMPIPAASLARDLYQLAMAEGQRGKDIVAVLEMYRRWGDRAA